VHHLLDAGIGSPSPAAGTLGMAMLLDALHLDTPVAASMAALRHTDLAILEQKTLPGISRSNRSN